MMDMMWPTTRMTDTHGTHIMVCYYDTSLEGMKHGQIYRIGRYRNCVQTL